MLAYTRKFGGCENRQFPHEVEVCYAFNEGQMKMVREYFTLPYLKTFNLAMYNGVTFLTMRFFYDDYMSFLGSELYKYLNNISDCKEVSV